MKIWLYKVVGTSHVESLRVNLNALVTWRPDPTDMIRLLVLLRADGLLYSTFLVQNVQVIHLNLSATNIAEEV